MKDLIFVALLMVLGTVDKAVAAELDTKGTWDIKSVFNLGQYEEDAKIIYNEEYTYSYDQETDISVDFDYPSRYFYGYVKNINIITRIVIFVEADDDGSAQVYLSKGGLGELSVSLRIEAKNTNELRYGVVIYGKQV